LSSLALVEQTDAVKLLGLLLKKSSSPKKLSLQTLETFKSIPPATGFLTGDWEDISGLLCFSFAGIGMSLENYRLLLGNTKGKITVTSPEIKA